MEAILEIQQLARKSSTDIVDLVRSAYIVAKKLGLQDFADWCNAELEGYLEHPNVSVFKYREVGTIQVIDADDNVRCIPYSNKGQQKGVGLKFISDGLPDLVKKIKNKKNIILDFPPGFIEHYQDLVLANRVDYAVQHIIYGIQAHYNKLEDVMSLLVSEFEIHQILNAVQKKILDWSLECEAQGILGKEWQFSPKEKAMAQNVTYNINTLQNMANHNTESTINQTTQNISVTKGDLQSLVNFLSDKGISESEIQEFKEIIDIEPNITVDGIQNSKIQQWLGKIAVGGSLVAKGVAIDVIVEAIKQFF